MSPRVLKRSPLNCGKNSLMFFLSSTYLRMFHVLDLEENSCFVCLLCFYSIIQWWRPHPCFEIKLFKFLLYLWIYLIKKKKKLQDFAHFSYLKKVFSLFLKIPAGWDLGHSWRNKDICLAFYCIFSLLTGQCKKVGEQVLLERYNNKTVKEKLPTRAHCNQVKVPQKSWENFMLMLNKMSPNTRFHLLTSI